MQDADYFRSQAEMYFKLARLMSVRSDAAIFRAEAEHCLAWAVQLDETPATSIGGGAVGSSIGTKKERLKAMPLFFFPVDYKGSRHEDERGELMATAEEAISHARLIAEELSRNNSKPVTVFVVADDQSSVIHTVNGTE